MGINKAQVRWIAHFQPPVLLAEYLQEIGRAGRDGKPAAALLLTCEPTGLLYPEDRQRHKFFTQQVDRSYEAATALAKQLPVRGNISEIERKFPQAATALSLLHSIGELVWETPFEYRRKESRSGTKLAIAPIAATVTRSTSRGLYQTSRLSLGIFINCLRLSAALSSLALW